MKFLLKDDLDLICMFYSNINGSTWWKWWSFV